MQEIANNISRGFQNLAGDIASYDWELLFIWCLLMAIDIATGYIKACKQNNASSNTMRTGIYRKMLDTFSILAILLMQGVVTYFGITAPIGPTLIGAFCLKEVTSILENAFGGRPNAMPKVVRSWLENIQSIFSVDNNNNSGNNSSNRDNDADRKEKEEKP